MCVCVHGHDICTWPCVHIRTLCNIGVGMLWGPVVAVRKLEQWNNGHMCVCVCMCVCVSSDGIIHLYMQTKVFFLGLTPVQTTCIC